MKKIKVSGEQMARMVLACLGLCEIIDIDINGKETVKVMCKVKKKELLSTTDESIKEIAYRLNFESPDYFSSKFKAKTGMKPSDFRAMNR